MNAEKFEEVRLIVAASNYTKVALQFVGVGESTFYRWLEKPENREYRESLRQAGCAGEIGAAGCLTSAARTDWKAAVAYLERRWPERWRKITSIDISSIPDEQLLRLLGMTEGKTEAGGG